MITHTEEHIEYNIMTEGGWVLEGPFPEDGRKMAIEDLEALNAYRPEDNQAFIEKTHRVTTTERFRIAL